MANKKPKADEVRPQSESSKHSGDGPRELRIMGRRLTAKDAGWRSPTLFVAPLTFVPIDPPEPLPESRRRR